MELVKNTIVLLLIIRIKAAVSCKKKKSTPFSPVVTDREDVDKSQALHSADKVVGVLALALCYFIKGGDEQTRHRQKEQQPGLRGTQLGGCLLYTSRCV